jgi:hypothetical protein
MELITYGYIIDKSRYLSLLLSPQLPLLYDKIKNFLVIYALNSKLSRITCYPLEDPSCLKISIAIPEFDRKITENLSKIFDDFKLIHTTGVCEVKSGFGLEYYLFTTNLEGDRKKILALIESQQLSNVSQVEKVPILQ